MNQYKKLFWQCRRGMKEMDILLLNYLENCYRHSSNKEQRIFTELLKEEDADIMSWIQKTVEVDKKYFALIQSIRTISNHIAVKTN